MKRLTLVLLVFCLLTNASYGSFQGNLKADTTIIVKVGPFVDVGDGFTPQTDIGDPDGNNDLDGVDESYIIKHNAADNAAIQINSSGQDLLWDQIDNMDGWYNLTLGTAETDTEGMLTLIIQDDSDCLPVTMSWMVMNDNTYEAFYENASELLAVDMTQIETADATDTMLTAQEIEDEAVDALESFDLDHLIAVACDTGPAITDHVLDNTILAFMLDDAGDISEYDDAKHSQVAIGDDADLILADTGTDGVVVASIDGVVANATTIATLASQTSFTLTAGSADDNAYNNCVVEFEDASTAAQRCMGVVKDYTGSSKTVTLWYDPGVFTMQATDKVRIKAELMGNAQLASRYKSVMNTIAYYIERIGDLNF